MSPPQRNEATRGVQKAGHAPAAAQFRLTLFALLACALLPAGVSRGGYELPCYIDGSQSPDGRFVVTAEPVGKTTNHGPNRWRFHWRDATTGESRAFDAAGLQGGQIHAHLFVPPDGRTFALFNHVTLWTEGKSDSHGAAKLCDKPGIPRDRADPAFSRRLLIYSAADGAVLKSLGATDLLAPEEWESVVAAFNRVHWIKEYPGLNFKRTPRPGYAFYRISPDHTVLEFLAVPPRTSKDKAGRPVRVRLTDGHVLGAEEKLDDPAQIPMRSFKGPDALPGDNNNDRERYEPSLDPVRTEGRLLAEK